MAGYAILLVAALALNFREWRMLALTLVVGASIFVPVPRDSALHFYTFCFCSELLVALLAMTLRTRASTLIALICSVLAVSQVLGYVLNGYPPLSPYRLIIKILEHLQLIICIVFSAPLIRKVGNHESSTI